MPGYLAWDREVLEECYDQVDGLSLHAYYGNTARWSGNSTARYLAMNLDMDRHIHEVAAVCDYVQGLQRSSKRLWLSFDEWNVWYRARDAQATDGKRAAAPRLLEEVYNLEDALLVGGFVNTLLRNSDRVRVACLAQLVNVIAPLVTNDRGVLRQSTYYPYAWALRYARGRVLDLRVESETYPMRRRTAVRLRPQRRRAVRRPGGDDRRAGQAGRRADAQSRPRRRTRGRARVGGRRPDPGARVRDAHRAGPEGVQHLRGAPARGPAAAAAPAAGARMTLQAAAALVYGAAPDAVMPTVAVTDVSPRSSVDERLGRFAAAEQERVGHQPERRDIDVAVAAPDQRVEPARRAPGTLPILEVLGAAVDGSIQAGAAPRQHEPPWSVSTRMSQVCGPVWQQVEIRS